MNVKAEEKAGWCAIGDAVEIHYTPTEQEKFDNAGAVFFPEGTVGRVITIHGGFAVILLGEQSVWFPLNALRTVQTAPTDTV